MGDAPFRDVSAAIERATRLEQDNRELRSEVERLRNRVQELQAVRGLNDRAYVRRLTQERDDLADEARVLREKTAKQEAELRRGHRIEEIHFERGLRIARVLDGLVDGMERLIGTRAGK